MNEGVRRAAFDEGVRLTGTLRLGEVACSATSSDSIAAARCVFFTGVFMTPLGPTASPLAFAPRASQSFRGPPLPPLSLPVRARLPLVP